MQKGHTEKLVLTALTILILYIHTCSSQRQKNGIVIASKTGYSVLEGSLSAAKTKSPLLEECYTDCLDCVCGWQNTNSDECLKCDKCYDWIWRCSCDKHDDHDDRECFGSGKSIQTFSPTINFAPIYNFSCSGNQAAQSNPETINSVVTQLNDCRDQNANLTCQSNCQQISNNCMINCTTATCTQTCATPVACVQCIATCVGLCEDGLKTCESVQCGQTQ